MLIPAFRWQSCRASTGGTPELTLSRVVITNPVDRSGIIKYHIVHAQIVHILKPVDILKQLSQLEVLVQSLRLQERATIHLIMALAESFPFSEGEKQMHELLHVPPGRENPTVPFFYPRAGYMTAQAPLMAVGALDSEKRPWTTLWGGAPGFAGPMGQPGTARGNILLVKAQVDKKYDPVAQILATGDFKKSSRTDASDGIMVSALPIDLESRTRVKIFGREIAGQLIQEEDSDEMKDEGKVAELQMLVHVEQSLGMCLLLIEDSKY
jgi:hypothetical protein